MKMKFKTLALTAALALTLIGSSVLPAQAKTNSHVHNYTKWTYVKTTQDGSYTHSYITGVNPITGKITYGNCLVMCETEYYTYRCNEPGCYATDGSLNPVYVETHGSCPQ